MSRNYLANNDLGWAKKKGADSHATPRPHKQTKMREMEKIDTDQFLVPPKEAFNLRLDGDVKTGGNKKSERTSGFRGR
ncbi:hypothetical protein DICPUDRAFT_30759 [Dictyostelium purpureum]|uniref:Uncharacterized protein n=1 Tax=Dictyostelium purpureum TaxID=5786 RepID=F0ZG14_DICPU|nr:uncharacterized protein DICPUDRAFT_30759 [Dictyostelium purpureum]EGC37139.1 hypothetical protein DICPUDRAFT_30759 [Dictyostelium purpureum]|eukprot:XP_003286342.1 hypothetical protein DICPUDRAFT_30759 [Dictyostelium purpureum]